MANPKGNPQNLKPGQGRPKGTMNKFTTLKDAFLKAFEQLGGIDELVKWSGKESNKKHFYSMIAKMLPKTVDVDQKSNVKFIIEIPKKSKEKE